MRLIVTLLLIVISTAIQAVTIDELSKTGQLQVRYTVVGEDNIIQYQPVAIEIEVSTDRWFAGGSKVKRFDIPDALVYRSGESATNSSRTTAGKTRALQLWTLIFYPQKSGSLLIPELTVSVSLNTEGNKIVEGELSLPAKTITVLTPDAMKGMDNWLAAKDLVITESYQGIKERYQPGDAITRTITLRIEGSPAMMLPDIKVEDIEGLAIYRVPPKVTETSHRGQLVGNREQQFIMTIEQAGEYQIPGFSYPWWDLQNQQQALIELPALVIATQSGSGAINTQSNPSTARTIPWQGLGYFLLLVLVVLSLMLVIARSGLKLKIKQRKQQQEYDQAFLNAIDQGQAVQALQCLYRLIDNRPQYQGVATLEAVFTADKSCQQLLQQLKRHACGSGEPANLSVTEAKLLLAYINKPDNKRWPWQQAVVLSLNH